MFRTQPWFCFTAITLSCCTAQALTLGPLFQDHMVLQRDMPVPVWGTAEPGEQVSVRFASRQQTTTADAAGAWRVDLEPLHASAEGRTLTISSKASKVEISDVVVGEVWICSGQSNMQFPVNRVPEVKALERSATNLRSFQVERTVAFTEQTTCSGEWVTRHADSAVAFGFAYHLQEMANVPVGVVLTCWGSSSIEAWMPRDMVDTVPHFRTMMQEFDADQTTRDRIQAILDGPRPWSQKDDIFLRRQTNILYNAMLRPLAPYACRGVVWYQGERNTQSMFGMVRSPWYSRNSGMVAYGPTLRQWVLRCRKQWGRDDLHFLVVMLPRYGGTLPTGASRSPDAPDAHSWAWMREAQLSVLKLPDAGVANTIDLGDGKNMHPTDKLPIGQRLALLAARDTLGEEVEADGPAFARLELRAGAAVVHFTHAAGLTTTNGEDPTGFWLSEDAHDWAPAEAAIEGQAVVLRSTQTPHPKHVRYAFAGNPNVNLVNAAGLPAYPFRTDSYVPRDNRK